MLPLGSGERYGTHKNTAQLKLHLYDIPPSLYTMLSIMVACVGTLGGERSEGIFETKQDHGSS